MSAESVSTEEGKFKSLFTLYSVKVLSPYRHLLKLCLTLHFLFYPNLFQNLLKDFGFEVILVKDIKAFVKFFV